MLVEVEAILRLECRRCGHLFSRDETRRWLEEGESRQSGHASALRAEYLCQSIPNTVGDKLHFTYRIVNNTLGTASGRTEVVNRRTTIMPP